MKTFTHPVETWDAAKCEKVAKHRSKDGCGMLHPYPGRIAASASSRPQYGQTVRYNGGIVIGGEWYEAEAVPLPLIVPGFAFLKRVSWGTYLVRDDETHPMI